MRRERGDCLGPEWSDIIKLRRTSGDRDDARMTSVGKESFGSRRLRSLRVADLSQRVAEQLALESADQRFVYAEFLFFLLR